MPEYTRYRPAPVLVTNARILSAQTPDRLCDVRFTDTVTHIGQLQPQADDTVFAAQGRLLLPGLHDHHIHLNALAAARRSIDATGHADLASLSAAIDALPAGIEARVVGYHETLLGELDRWLLDQWQPQRAVRVQHSSGKLWVLNSAALAGVSLKQAPTAAVDKDHQGRVTGRLYRLDEHVRGTEADSTAQLQALRRLSEELNEYGITGVTDASYTNDAAAAEQLHQLDNLNLRVMGVLGLNVTPGIGQYKIMLDGDALPDFAATTVAMQQAHEQGRGVAFHCVTHAELVYALALLDAAGHHRDDRIEHGAMIHTQALPQLQAAGVTVVTQPGFIADRGGRYRQQIAREQWPDLYRYQSLLNCGVPVAASSDAPYGPVNPWQVMAAAVTRMADDQQTLGVEEAVHPAEALRGYLAPLDNPGGAPRSIAVGATADLCLLPQGVGVPEFALQGEDLAHVRVDATWVRGVQVWRAPD